MKKQVKACKQITIMTFLCFCVAGFSQTGPSSSPVTQWTNGAYEIRNTYGSVIVGPLNQGWCHMYSDMPNFIFNKSVWSIPGSFSSYSTSDLSLQTNGTTRLTLKNSNGFIGIGTTSPSYMLDIDNGKYGSGQIRWHAPNSQYGFTYADASGIGITDSDPYSELVYLQKSNNSINFYTKGSLRGIIDANGNVVLNGTTPLINSQLTIYGTQTIRIPGRNCNLNIANWTLAGAQTISFNAYDDAGTSNVPMAFAASQFYFHAGSVGVGTTTTYTKLDIGGTNMYINSHNGLPQYIANWASSGVWGIGAIDDSRNTIRIGAVNHPSMTWNSSLPIRLDVAGEIRANKVVVNTTGADFVFDNNYKLKSLIEVEKYVTEHKHLPDVASAKEMQTNGVDVNELQTKLLQKVEELTLYIIEQEKKMNLMNQEIEKLKGSKN